MKKLLLSISVVMLITSCGSKDESTNESDAATDETSINEEKEAIYLTAFDVLSTYQRDKEASLERLRGRTVYINDIAAIYGDLDFTYGVGFNETEASATTTYLLNESLLTYKDSRFGGYSFAFHIINATFDGDFKVGDREYSDVDGVKTNVINEVINIEIPGDSIIVYSSSKLELRGAKIIKRTIY